MKNFTTDKLFGFWFEETELDSGPAFFGGDTLYGGAICPNCKDHLFPLLTIDLHSDQLVSYKHISKNRYIPLFYCWTCGEFEGGRPTFFYEFSINSIKYLKYPKGKKQTDWPYPNYGRIFAKVYLKLNAHNYEDISYLNQIIQNQIHWIDVPDKNWGILKHYQLLYNPILEEYKELMEKLDCPKCFMEMYFLGKFADQISVEKTFVGDDSPIMVFHICPKCQIIGTYHYVD